MNDPSTLVVWESGFEAGMTGSLDNPAYDSRDLRLFWRAAWMSGRKCAMLVKDKMDEQAHQVLLFRWAEAAVTVRPELRLMYSIPNGGLRHIAVAAKLKAAGAKAGVPDVCLPIPRYGCGSLYIELKADKGRASKEQQQWLHELDCVGNAAVLCFGWRDAKQAVCDYLDGATED